MARNSGVIGIAVSFAFGGLLISVVFSEDAAAIQTTKQNLLESLPTCQNDSSLARALGPKLNRKNYDTQTTVLYILGQLWQNRTWNQTS